MSVPARGLPSHAPLDPQTSPERPGTSPRPAPPSRRVAARRSFHLRFAILTAALVTVALVSLVSMQAMIAQSSFHTAELQTRIADLSDRYDALMSDAAKLSAPGRIEAWALAHGMRRADAGHMVILSVPARDVRRLPVASRLGRDAALVKPIIGSTG